MTRYLVVCVGLAGLIGTFTASTAYPQSPPRYEDHLRNLQEIRDLQLSESDTDDAIRKYVKGLRDNCAIARNLIDTNTRSRPAGDRRPETAPQRKSPDTITRSLSSLGCSKKTLNLAECLHKCFESGKKGAACCDHCMSVKDR